MSGVDLIYHNGFPWHSEGSSHVKGFAHVAGEKFLKGNSLLRHFSAGRDFEDFVSRVSGANGMFSVVIERGDSLWMAVDRMRTFPLFYVPGYGYGTPPQAVHGAGRPESRAVAEPSGRENLRSSGDQEWLVSDSTDRIVERLGGWSLDRVRRALRMRSLVDSF